MNTKNTFSINKLGKLGRVIANGNCSVIKNEQEALEHAIAFVPETKSVIRQSSHDYHKHGMPIAEMNVYGDHLSTYLLLRK